MFKGVGTRWVCSWPAGIGQGWLLQRHVPHHLCWWQTFRYSFLLLCMRPGDAKNKKNKKNKKNPPSQLAQSTEQTPWDADGSFAGSCPLGASRSRAVPDLAEAKLGNWFCVARGRVRRSQLS